MTCLLTIQILIGAAGLTGQASPVPGTQQLRHRIEAYLALRYSGLPVRLQFEWPELKKSIYPMETVDSLLINYPAGRRPRGNTVVSVDAYWNGKIIRRFNYTLRVRVFRRVWQATERLEAHQPVPPASLKQAECEITRLRGEPVDDLGGLAGKILTRSLAPGKILTADLLQEPPLISRGDQVELVFQKSALSIKMQATALQNGAAGEVIWFFFPESRKRFKGRVVGQDLAMLVSE